MKCKKGYDVHVMRSAAGYFMGTTDENGMPNCRISGYATNPEEAEKLALDRQHHCIENDGCNGNGNCFK